ncbi:MAG: AI-2E family transporter [Bdellovibrionota bacterium]|nr:MAG: AI-2E family transporter [Bdellovibrionota bacterium]
MTTHANSPLEKLRWALTLAFLMALLAGLYFVFLPFLKPIAWAIIVTLATWPLYCAVQRRLNQSGGQAAGVMTGLLAVFLLGVVVPVLTLLAIEVRDGVTSGFGWINTHREAVHEMATAIPWVGESAQKVVAELLPLTPREEAVDQGDLISLARQYQETILRYVGMAARGLFTFLFQVLVFLVTSYFIYRHGRTLGKQFTSALSRIGGQRFERLLGATVATLKGTVYGVLATAFAQGTLAGIGYVVAGAPTPILLSGATMLLSLVPFGTPFVYIPAAILVAVQGSLLWGVVLVLWGILVVSTVDNLLRPIFISQATRLNVLMVFFAVLGGVISFGLIGIFLGPIIVAVATALWHEWVEHHEHTHAHPAGT